MTEPAPQPEPVPSPQPDYVQRHRALCDDLAQASAETIGETLGVDFGHVQAIKAHVRALILTHGLEAATHMLLSLVEEIDPRAHVTPWEALTVA
jgi:hypothetical protein